MTESHDPMCSVPLSYLTTLQERGDGEKQYNLTWQPGDTMLKTPQQLRAESEGKEPTPAGMLDYAATMQAERDEALERIAAFEERAGCKLEEIPVEALNAAQDHHVNQQAIDELKRQNDRLSKNANAAESEVTEWRGRYKEAQRELDGLIRAAGISKAGDAAPWGVKKDGTPKKRPGRKVPRKRAA